MRRIQSAEKKEKPPAELLAVPLGVAAGAGVVESAGFAVEASEGKRTTWPAIVPLASPVVAVAPGAGVAGLAGAGGFVGAALPL
ncbi:MAG TPA: hypothetical protein VF306_19820, partial [Pirellulales bacterium]